MDKMRELEAPPSPQGYSGMQPDDPHRARIGPGSIAAKVRSPKGEKCICQYINMYAPGILVC